MSNNVIIVGGNGFVGREITMQWANRFPEAEIYITSRGDRKEIQGAHLHHVQVDVNDAQNFENALHGDEVDYIITLTYGSQDAVKTVRDFAEKHNLKAIGNVGIQDFGIPEMADFVSMKKDELKTLQEGSVRIANYDATVIWSKNRNDEIGKGVKAGNYDEMPPVSVEVVAEQLIDRTTKAWRA
ncbi:NAD-dependent epimerase/dehydratase family protein [Staphylococcus condimenti]|uniref:NAD-dependent epimerase/dehydratase family protein n=1 Tax=Staphylococcus condimenti TaxID=70255 RepID=A0A4Q7CRQ8_9STAP|nr:NAD-dependent epimerase/dehydratase family protein [Staphylococcus condimenti]RZI00545.1 NAD-dependent epimerase/dehydratase family protein [Staphylococcus condimenti]RZI04277.1 NAD-dependent epimerase/dehydratase family protein [Staphylococcus condimenti]